MAAAFNMLRSYPAIGDFLAFQFLIDLDYSTVLDLDAAYRATRLAPLVAR
jgi:hypothetical protein